MMGWCIVLFIQRMRWFNVIAPNSLTLLIWAIFFAACAAFMYPVPIFMAWTILDTFYTQGEQMSFPWFACLLSAGSVLLGCIFRASSSYLAHKSAFLFCGGLRLALMEHIGKLPLHWLSTQSSGKLKKIFLENVGEIEGFVSHNIPDFVYALIFPILSISCLFFVDWRMALILAALLLLAIFVQGLSLKKMQNTNVMHRYQEALSLLHADAVEFVQGMPEVKIFNRSTQSFGRMQKAINNMYAMQKESISFYAVQWVRFLAVINLPFTLLACIGAFLFLTYSLSLPDLAIFITLGGITLLPMNRLVRFMSIIITMVQGWAEIHKILDVPMEKRGNKCRDDVLSPDLDVQNLKVSYDKKTVLKGISFTAKAGTVTAIVGPSGSGKSTLAAVLAGMEKVESGSITLGGIELMSFSPKELALTFAIVYQNPFIFSGTVRDNLILGSENATQEEIEHAVRMTCCDKFIASLPNGYDTHIGSEGEVHLSGGQKQRIALARMALRNTPVVLLDEATAFADPESELAIQEGLSSFLNNKTVLVIAHRLSSIAHADNIIVLESGNIIEQGRHDDLLQADGVYAHLWEAHHASRSWVIANKDL